ncbi:uncharacterized protein [Dermacentor andersoni]|uniref:uncharacterized protein n=1 Tax=Dermacentor andersoni TaxID=34620 RepID=UPI002415FC0F|nr:uncharacterized protein LOC129382959 [Dermacentor andersoni]
MALKRQQDRGTFVSADMIHLTISARLMYHTCLRSCKVPSVALSGISKAGIDALTRLSAVEYAPYGIRVNSINPGPIETKMVFREEMSSETQKTLRSRLEKSNLMGRIGTVEEAARVIAFLASDRASFITGHSLPVDGGSLLVGPMAATLAVKKGADLPTAN